MNQIHNRIVRAQAAFAEIDGPKSIFGYDGKIHWDRGTPNEWRQFWLIRAREMGSHTQAEWIELRDSIGQCLGCGRNDIPLSKDHIFPISRGGCDCIKNLQPLCHPCNSKKGAR